ncbi:MAG: hypothetical protein U0892_14035 [Pirellulales bacterium]
MNRSCAGYSDDALVKLLHSTDDECQPDSADHLAECPHCQARLERLAAEPEHWTENTRQLADEL